MTGSFCLSDAALNARYTFADLKPSYSGDNEKGGQPGSSTSRHPSSQIFERRDITENAFTGAVVLDRNLNGTMW